MLIAVIVVALVAVGLLVLYLMAKSSAAEFKAQAEQREAALVTERDELAESKSELETQLADLEEKHKRQAKKLTKKAEEVRRLGSQLDKARDDNEEKATTISGQSEEISKLVSEAAQLRTRIEEAEAAALAAMARNTGIVVGNVLDVSSSQPETLWDLELKRSERTWRTSVATNPANDENPFETADDPVRKAVEIEAAALRENVGAFITIDWQASLIDDPARRHLVVRVAQEMLEAAARSPEASRLVVTDVEHEADTGSDETSADVEDAEEGASATREINLRLEPAGDDEVINIIPPRITSNLLDIRDETGSNITIKASHS